MSSDRRRQHLVIFTRRPCYGVGKRRLAAEAGEMVAWRFQRFALANLLGELARDPRWTTWLAITPDRPTGWVNGPRPIGQGRGHLGERLDRLAKRLPRGSLVILGSDAPQVTRQDVAAAFRFLGRCEAVFGPSVDGGYWLVGLSVRGRLKPPFDNVRWSTAHALSDTLANLRGCRIGLLRELEDVDDAVSLRRLQSGPVVSSRAL
jgi:glycosyltransferase A (GT-A) superfamily protein (DUF2064 family)